MTYDAALACARAAKEEAAATARTHNAALARAAKVRAVVVAVVAPPKLLLEDPPAGLSDLQAAMLIHEAAALLNLHVQAVTVNNIRSLISIILDIDSGNFGR